MGGNFAIAQPNASAIQGDTLLCRSVVAQYTTSQAPGEIYFWEIIPANAGTFVGASGNTGASIQIQWNLSGNFQVKRTELGTGQSESIPVKVIDAFDPPRPIEPIQVYMGESFSLSATGNQPGAIFRWYLDASLSDLLFTGAVYAPTVNLTLQGTISFFVTQGGGNCESAPTEVRVRIVGNTLPVPTSVFAQQGPNQSIEVFWRYQTAVDSFVVERSTQPNTGFAPIGGVPYKTNDNLYFFADNVGLEQGITYYYRVKAVTPTQFNESRYSNITSAKLNTPPVIGDLLKEGDANQMLTFQKQDFLNFYADADSDTLFSIIILSFPSNGLLLLGQDTVKADQIIRAGQLSRLAFVPRPDWHGTTFFAVKASDGKDFSDPPSLVEIYINPPPPAPDLQALSLRLSPESGSQQTDFEAEISVKNIGVLQAAVSGAQLLLSADSVADESDALLHTFSLPDLFPEESFEDTYTFRLAQNLPNGTYYLVLAVDAANSIAESDETNNALVYRFEFGAETVPLVIMNVITPNEDWANDWLVIENLELYPEHEVVVLDAWGREQFRSTEYYNDWRATDQQGQTLPPGTYLCIVTVKGDAPRQYKELISIVLE